MEFVVASKRSRLANNDGETRRATTINDLPNVILCYIVSLLPLRDAVMTGVLSKAWRNIWSSMPNWDLAYVDFPRIKNKRKNFEDFIERVIYFHTGPGIQSMRIAHHYYDSSSRRAVMWIDYLTRNRIMNLEIDISFPVALPFSVFTCDTLVCLKLRMHEMCVRMPANICLPNLKKLWLEEVVFHGASIFQRLLDGCPNLMNFVLKECLINGPRDVDILINQSSLTYLSFINCRFFHQAALVLSAANLTEFRYKGMNFVLGKYSLSILSAIKEARLDIEEQGGRYLEYRRDGFACVLGKNMNRILWALRNVTDLFLSEWCIEYLTTISNIITLPPFMNLKSLSVSMCPNRGHAYILVKIINAARGLQFLSITSLDCSAPGIYYNEERIYYYPETPDIMRNRVIPNRLKKIELKKFGTMEDEMMLVMYLLRSSVDLEHLIIKCASWADVAMRSLIRKRIRAFFRASPNVAVRIN
ncbi:F-box/LRR-repeat protein At3g26922-like [Typha latifolia]|uniref:F-box/LRR-repeat protein At3g26922-like n=1 Tax=Typha latifolia TaxID=4733 RepID=UPI003C2FD047